MLSAYDHRLVLFYLSNAVSHLRYRAEAAKDLARWLMDHEEELKFRYPQTPDSVTAVVMWHGSPPLKEEPSREWQRLIETLQNEFAATRQARPDRTAKRLRQLARAVGLTRIDTAILELMLGYGTVPFVESMVDFIFSSTMTSNNIRLRVGNPIFPCLLGVSPGAVHCRFAPDAPLVTSGLVSIDDEGEVSLISQLARLHWLPKVAGSDVRRLLLGEAGPTELRWSDFDYVAGDRDYLERILNGALRTGQKGVNVLVYGPPGTGKTEFCKTLAARLKAPLYVVGESDSEGGEPCHKELGGKSGQRDADLDGKPPFSICRHGQLSRAARPGDPAALHLQDRARLSLSGAGTSRIPYLFRPRAPGRGLQPSRPDPWRLRGRAPEGRDSRLPERPVRAHGNAACGMRGEAELVTASGLSVVNMGLDKEQMPRACES